MATITTAISAEGRVRNMDVEKVIDCLQADKEYLTDMKICDGEEMDIAIQALIHWQKILLSKVQYFQ